MSKSKSKLRVALRWVIIGNCGLYEGQWLRRKDAIASHTEALFRIWPACVDHGDRVVKARVTYVQPPVAEVKKVKRSNFTIEWREDGLHWIESCHVFATSVEADDHGKMIGATVYRVIPTTKHVTSRRKKS